MSNECQHSVRVRRGKSIRTTACHFLNLIYSSLLVFQFVLLSINGGLFSDHCLFSVWIWPTVEHHNCLCFHLCWWFYNSSNSWFFRGDFENCFVKIWKNDVKKNLILYKEKTVLTNVSNWKYLSACFCLVLFSLLPLVFTLFHECQMLSLFFSFGVLY